MSETITTPHVDTPGGERKSGRLAALDAARGLAVIGMYVQHFALNERNSFVSGNTMILFILCSGISYSIMVRRMNEKGMEPSAFRARMLARAVFIDMAGYLLIMLNGPFAVVLPAYAMLFLLALLLIRSSARTLTAVSCVSFLVCPPLMLIGLSLFSDAALLYDLAGGPLSALAWLPVFTAGMALGRMELRSTRTAVRLVLGGAALLIPCKLFDIFLLPGIRQGFEAWLMRMPVNYQIDEYAIWPRNAQPVLWHMLFYAEPQGGSSFELLIGTGLSLIILGLLFLIEKKYGAVLRPFAAAGRVVLTLYVFQFIVAWALMLMGIDVTGIDIGGFLFGDILIAAGALFAAWGLTRRQNGPVEFLLRRFERLFCSM